MTGAGGLSMKRLLSGFSIFLGVCAAATAVRADELFPIYPPYPYRAGYYATADWYYSMPPYVALKPSFHRKRFFMMAQERDRYRYIPHTFSGYSDEDGSYLK
jgi:hypothetical protein